MNQDLNDFLVLADQYKKNRDFKTAIEHYYKSLSLSPDNPDILSMIGDCYIGLGDIDRAKNYYDTALEIDKSHKETLLGLINVYRLQKDLPKTEEYLKELLKVEKDFSYHKELVESYFSSSKVKEARCFIKNVMLEKFPNSDECYYLLGVCDAKEERYEDASENFYKALELNPDNLDVRIALGKLFYCENRFEDAKNIFQYALSLNFNLKEPHYYMGLIYSALENYEEAIAEFKFVVEAIDATDINSYMNLGLCYSLIGWQQEAAYAYHTVLQIHPQDTEAKYALAYLYYQEGLYDRSEEFLNKLIDSGDEEDSVFWLKSKILTEKKNYKEALYYLDQALKVNKDDEKIYNAIANIYNTLDMKDKALEYYLSAVSKDSGHIENYIEIAKIYEDKKMYDMAIEYYQKVVEKNPKYINSYIGLAYCYKHLGNKEKALEYFSYLVSKSQNMPEIFTEIANIKKEKEEYSEAFKYYMNALQLKPDSAKLHYEIGQIFKLNNDFDNSIKYLKEAVSLDNMQKDYYKALGEAYIQVKKFDEAVNELHYALRFDPNDYGVCKNLVACYKSMKKPSKAKKLLNRFAQNCAYDSEQMRDIQREIAEIRKLYSFPLLDFFKNIFKKKK